MNQSTSIIKYTSLFIGCLVIFSIPIIGILAIWGFDIDNLKTSFSDLVVLGDNTYIQQDDQNFEVQAGEDALLTTTIINQGREIEITKSDKKALKIFIKSAQIEGSVVYGHDGKELLKQGFWHLPGTLNPGEKGVSAIFGHRRHHLPPLKDTFYNLDKVGVGDRVEVELEDGTWLEYTVVKVDVVNPEDLIDVINEQSGESLIKLITCTPLGTDLQRLVVTAEKTI